MRKTPLIVLIFILVFVAIVLSVYFVLKGLQQRDLQMQADPLSFVPASAELVAHIRKPDLLADLAKGSETFAMEATLLFPDLPMLSLLSKLDSLFTSHTRLHDRWIESQLVISLHPGKSDLKRVSRIQLVFHGRPFNKSDQNLLISRLLGIQETPTKNIDGLYEGLTIEAATDLFFSFENNTLVVSAVKGYASPFSRSEQAAASILDDPLFSSMTSVSGRFSDNLYIRSSLLCQLAPEILTMDLPINLRCEKMAQWHQWDLSYGAGELYLTGYAQASITDAAFTSILLTQQPLETQILEYITPDPVAILYKGIAQTGDYLSAWAQWAEDNHLQEQSSRQKERFRDISATEPDSLLQLWTGELAWVVPGAFLRDQDILILGLSGDLKETLPSSLHVFLTEVPGNAQEAFMRVNTPGFFSAFTGGLVVSDYNYLAEKDSYLFAANNVRALEDYLGRLHLGQNFSQSDNAASIKEFMQSKQSLFVHLQLQEIKSVDFAGITRDDQSQTDRSAGSRDVSRSFSMQLIPAPNRMVFSNALLWHQTEYTASTRIKWETQLDTTVHAGPFRVFNHNTQEVEFILQDNRNNLYLVDKQGKILWKKEISGPSMSDIYQVDIYKNNRYQYIFNTRNFLHIIDRNGNYVRGFPMRLPAPASAGIAVFDYDQDKNYRVVFPAENHRIYNYNLRGQAVTGWEYGTSETMVQHPVQYLRLGRRDYLFVTDTTGHVEVLNRRGAIRIKPAQRIKSRPGAPIFKEQKEGSKPHFLLAGKDGVITRLFPDGAVSALTSDTLQGTYDFFYYPFTDKANNELIFLHKGNLRVYDLALRNIISLSLDRGMTGEMKLMKFDDARQEVIIVTDREGKKIFAVDATGRVPMPFPVEGTAPPQTLIDENGMILLITAYENYLKSYILQ